MRGINKVTLIGNVGANPDVRYFDNGDAVANVNLATSESWKDKNTGEVKERTEWHRVVFRGKLAQIVEKFVQKGTRLYVEGQLRTRKWQDQSGADRYTTEVVVGFQGTMLMLDGKPAEHGSGSPGPAHEPRGNHSTGTAAPHDGDPGAGFDDDIPF